MVGNIDNVNDISPLKQTWKIKVRVIRLWTTPGFNLPDEVNSIEMVLLDEKDGRIYATVKRSFVQRFISVLSEGKVYEISQFGVVQNSGSYRTTKHPFKISFQYSTAVREKLDVLGISRFGFQFIDFDDIIARVADENYLVDVIGKLDGYHEIEDFNKDGKSTKKIVTYLQDIDNRKINCTLWGDYAEKVASYLAEKNEGPAILIIQLCKIKDYQGNMGPRKLSNSLYASRLLINCNEPAVLEFKNKLTEGNPPILSQLSNQSNVSLNDDFINISQRKTLNQIKSSKEACICITLCTVLSLYTRHGWYYNACKKCVNKVIPDGSGFYCEKCDKIVTSTQLCFKVHLSVVDDDGGSANFVLFNNIVFSFIKRTAADLREEVVAGGDVNEFSERLNDFLGKKMLFKLQIKPNDKSTDPIYIVMKLCVDDELITSFIGDGCLTPDAKCKSVSSFLTDNDSKLNESEKESFSVGADNDVSVSARCYVTPAKRHSGDGVAVSDDGFQSTLEFAFEQSTSKLKKIIKVEKE